MRRTLAWNAAALSPYAQALKQIALKGAVALGPSAKEMELEMYRKGTLPADYRPPVQGKWDDTIERWAYAWQFPAEEGHDNPIAAIERNNSSMRLLIEFGGRLAASPPSSEPRSGVNSTVYKILPPESGTPPLLEASRCDDTLESAVEQLDEAQGNSMSVEQFAAESNIPVAYLDDQSERSNASKELCFVLESCGLEYTEEGLIVAISALARQHYYDAARAIFLFAEQVGLGPNAELYKALMKHAALKGDVNHSMGLIEEMKEKGITPRIGNWHELMRTFHKARDYPAVSQIVDNMKMYANIEPNELTFTLQLRALAKDNSQMNSLAEAIQLFDQMENVYGYIAARPHYDALMFHLSQSPAPEMRLRCEELAHKMELMGICWNSNTYLNLIRSAQVVGDVAAVEKYLGRMREDRIPMNILHLSWAVQAHVQHLIRLNYEELAEGKKDVLSIWLDHMETCFGVYELVVRRGWEMQLPFVNALLRLCCQTTMLCMEHLPSNTTDIGRFEAQANKLWNDTYDEWYLQKDVYSYECYMALLAFQQRIDEAEKLFQQMVLQEDLVPTRRTYECLMFMHLSSGEEGGAARALRYMEAMENARIPIRPSLLKKIVRVNNASGYKRDMKRRARRIMQAREEYLARKEEGLGFATPANTAEPAVDAEGNLVLQPLPVAESSTLAWWERWKRGTVSKHELFAEENADGTPKGESFEEKNEALKQMGIDSLFPTREDVPSPHKQKLLPKIRAAEGEMAGSLWAMDGGDYNYPRDGGGPDGWGVKLWRERAVVKKHYQDVLEGKEVVPAFSNLGNSVRVAGDQLEIEESGAEGPGELSDWRAYPDHRYDNGRAKPASEMAHPIQPSAELVWQGERRDSLAAYKSDEELALEADNTFYSQMEREAGAKVQSVVQVLQNKEEDVVNITGSGPTRRSKYDYLEQWREMYRHGTLEAPLTPPLRFGRTPADHSESMAATVKDWYRRNKKIPATDDQLDRWKEDASRDKEARVARRALKQGKRRSHSSRRTQ